jgi:dUTP pyrophosphatase
MPFSPQWPSEDIFMIERGDRIAQLMIIPIPQFEVVEVTSLSTTERGAGGLGSTGV